jgi:hypothetical protein
MTTAYLVRHIEWARWQAERLQVAVTVEDPRAVDRLGSNQACLTRKRERQPLGADPLGERLDLAARVR